MSDIRNTDFTESLENQMPDSWPESGTPEIPTTPNKEDYKKSSK